MTHKFCAKDLEIERNKIQRGSDGDELTTTVYECDCEERDDFFDVKEEFFLSSYNIDGYKRNKDAVSGKILGLFIEKIINL